MACTLQIRRETFPFLAILKSPSNFLSRHNTEVSLSLFVDLINLGLEKGGQTWDNLNQNPVGKALSSKLCFFLLISLLSPTFPLIKVDEWPSMYLCDFSLFATSNH